MLYLALVVVVVLGALLATFLLRQDELKGAWALDDTTVYEFDGRGHGTLRLPLGSYDFGYTVVGDRLTIDFTGETATDAAYDYSVDASALRLDTNTGTVYWLEKQK